MKKHILWNFISFLLIWYSCGSQKDSTLIADQAIKEYLTTLNGVFINTPSNQQFLATIDQKIVYYKDYNALPLRDTLNTTLKYIFSEKNGRIFKDQLKKNVVWSEKPYVKQSIIRREAKNNYKDKTVYVLSHPVVTHDGNYVLLRVSFFNQRYMTGLDELLVFKKQKGRWIIYKRFELSLF
ncbi:MAG: hypothetical protein AAF934_11055 [Bacteroidota bacterium]